VRTAAAHDYAQNCPVSLLYRFPKAAAVRVPHAPRLFWKRLRSARVRADPQALNQPLRLRPLAVGFGRIVVSKIEAPNKYVSDSGVKWMSGSTMRQCDRALPGRRPWPRATAASRCTWRCTPRPRPWGEAAHLGGSQLRSRHRTLHAILRQSKPLRPRKGAVAGAHIRRCALTHSVLYSYTLYNYTTEKRRGGRTYPTLRSRSLCLIQLYPIYTTGKRLGGRTYPTLHSR
jgi:hypothetical protein